MSRGKATESVHIIRFMLNAGARAGVDPGGALDAIGLDHATFDNPDARVPVAMEEALWDVLAERSGDAAFGLHAGLALEPGEFDVMDYAIRSSATLRDALLNAVRYNRLLHDLAEFELAERERNARFDHTFRDDPKGACRHAGDFTLSSVYTVAQAITGSAFSPRRVEFQHTAPSDIAPYRTVFGCQPRFDCAQNRLEFDVALLDRPVASSDPALNRLLTRHADDLLSRLPDTDSDVDRVRGEVTRAMREGEPTIERVAERLHVTTRTLQRRLRESGTTFRAVVDELRKGLAERYLDESRLGVSEVAYLLGYSEPSAFHRAFRRWFGMPPARYRERLAGAGRVG